MKKTIFSILLLFMIFLSFGCDNKEENQIKLKDDLNVGVYSEATLYSLIENTNGAELLTDDYILDTSTLGEKEIIIKYKVNDVEYEGTFKINVVDTEKPTIVFKEEISTTVGKSIDLLKNVSVVDNSKEEIKANVEGEYDFNKEGTYNLKYVAVDSSNNKAEENFILNVNTKSSTDDSDNLSVGTYFDDSNFSYLKWGNNNRLYYGTYNLEADTDDFNGRITINRDGTATNTGYIYIKNKYVKKNLSGTWKVLQNGLLGLGYYNAPTNDGLFISWNDGTTSVFGTSSRFLIGKEDYYKLISGLM